MKTCTIFAKFYKNLDGLSSTTILQWNVDRLVWLRVKLFAGVILSSIVQQNPYIFEQNTIFKTFLPFSFTHYTKSVENYSALTALHFRPSGNFTQRVKFCHEMNRDMIRNECTNSWDSNFDLFGGTNDTIGAIKVYNYICQNRGQKSSNLFLNLQTFSNCSFEYQSPQNIFIPGKLIQLS